MVHNRQTTQNRASRKIPLLHFTFTLEKSNHTQNHRVLLESYLNQMNCFSMKHSEKDQMFHLCYNILNQFGVMCKEMIQQEDGMDPLSVIAVTSTFFNNELETFTTRHKREKQMSENRYYVAPKEIAIGTRIENMYDKEKQIEIPRLIQSTMQIIPIISTLKSFFDRKENLDMYFKHQTDHICQENVFENYCCGQNFKTEEFFQLNPNAIQLQLAIDDVEICDPLGSKSNLHKVCAVYFVIRNIPYRFNSKLNNIFLVCLCNVDDLKTKKLT